MRFRVTITGEDNMPQVTLTTPLAVDGVFELEDGSALRALAISYDPLGTPDPDMLIHAARVV